MVVLVPRQLRMTGMTGDVPYYGGRFTPAQAYAASHARTAPPPAPPPAPRPTPRPVPRPRPTPPADPVAALQALDHLRASGVVSEQEYDDLRARMQP